jgi:hypothetical protein
MNFDSSMPIEEFDPVTFELASGDQVKVSLGLFWMKVSEMDRSWGSRPYQYLAIRIYGNEGCYPRRMQQLHEMRNGKEFTQHYCSKIWQWLLGHISSRDRFDHDSTEDFLTIFEEAIDKIQAEDEDMLEHLERLPSYTLPDAFDRIDDSIFTDQTDPEPI